MNNSAVSDTFEIRRLLQDNLRRSGIGLLIFYIVSLLGSVVFCISMQSHSARQLSRTLRNELLVGNNSYATKIINQNMQEQFERVDYLHDNRQLFSLRSDKATVPVFMHSVSVPICLNLEQESCASALVFHYSVARYFPVITLMTVGMLVFSFISFLLFRQRLLRVFRQTLLAQKEAALGRLSAQICHDLKLPSLIFQKIASVESWAEFNLLQPNLDEHVRRLFSMIDKLKRLDLEGLVRPEPFILHRHQLELFLHSILPRERRLTLAMPEAIPLVADRDKLERSLANLVLNAEQAGAVLIQLELQVHGSGLSIRVINNGPEIPSAVVEWFIDNTAGKKSRVPVGLGLSMVRDTVWGHGGSCQLRSNQDSTEFELLLPHAVQTSTISATQAELAFDPEPIWIQPAIPEADTDRRAPQIVWVDPDLRPILEENLTAQQRQYFFLTDELRRLPTSVLVVSGQTAAIDAAIAHQIPAFYHSSSHERTSLLSRIQKRLNLLMPVAAVEGLSHKTPDRAAADA